MLLNEFKKNYDNVYSLPYVEADDIIMNMVIFLNDLTPPGFSNINIHILTNDNDYLQIMHNNV